MRVCLMLIVTLTISLFAAAQAVVTGSNWATTQGVAVVPAPISSPLIVTPMMHLGTPSMQVGATNATMGATPTPIPMVPEVVMPQTLVVQAPAVAAAPAQTPEQAASAPKILDRGVARFSNTVYRVGESQPNRRSLGEAAQEVRQRKGTTTARVYTNADIARLNQQSGVTMMPGTQPNASNPPNTSGILPQQSSPAQAQPEQRSQAEPRTVIGQQRTEAERAQNTMAQAAPPANAQPAVPQSDQNHQQRERLPNSSTFLPLIALVGFIGVVAGALLRR